MNNDSRSRFIIGSYFSYIGKEFIRLIIYFVLAAYMICNFLYLNVIFKNNTVTEQSFRNLKGAEYVLFDMGDVFKKINNPTGFYKNIKDTFGADGYALLPWILAQDADNTLFTTDANSLRVFDWNIEWGEGFSGNPNEVIAFKDVAKIGDIVTFTNGNDSCEFTVVGVYDTKNMPVIGQINTKHRTDYFAADHNDDGTIFNYTTLAGNLNYVTDSYNGFIINPIHDWTNRANKDVYTAGAFVKYDSVDISDEAIKDRINSLYACRFTDTYVIDSARNMGIIGYISTILSVCGFVIFTIIESLLRFHKYAREYNIWNTCGMSKKEIKQTFVPLFAFPTIMGIVVGFIIYMVNMLRFTSMLWTVIALVLCALIYVFCQFLINNVFFDGMVPLVDNEEHEFLGNVVDESFPLFMDKTVRFNLRVPIELANLNEEACAGAVDRALGIGYINKISELKCSDLTDYELVRVKLARACIIMPKTLKIGSEYNKLTEKQQTELGRFVGRIAKNWNVEIKYSQAFIEPKKSEELLTDSLEGESDNE